MRIVFALLCALLFAGTIAFPQALLVRDSLYSRSISGYAAVSILLPDGYSRTKERYPVIYLLHGFNGDDQSWFNSSRLIQLAASYRYILVSPNAGNSWYANSYSQPSARYEDLLVHDLIPWTDRKFRTHASRQHRSVVGFSMGGYGAVKYGIKYPGLFGFAAGISPSIQFPAGLEDSAVVARRSAASNSSVRAAFGPVRNERWGENEIFTLLNSADPTSLPYFYLSVGSSDIIPEIIEQTHLLADKFRKKKVFFEMHESEGGHDWKFWDDETESLLRVVERQSKRTPSK